MVTSVSSQWSSEEGKIDRYYRAISWWGVALATFGLVVLIFSLVTFPPE